MEQLNKLLKLDVNNMTEKKSGLTYLSWANAWKEFLKVYPDAVYTIIKGDNGIPCFGSDNMGYMCYTTVTAGDITREMWLPVMNGANKAMKTVPYKYKAKYGEKDVEAMSMFDVNKTVMRCLTKNLAMFGLGLYIYAGEDLPTEQEPGEQVTQITTNIVRAYLSHDKLIVDLKIKELKEKLNKKEILANQNLVDELIKEYGSLDSLNA